MKIERQASIGAIDPIVLIKTRERSGLCGLF